MYRALRTTSALVFLAVLTACPARHLQRGDAYAAQGEWAKAVSAYAKARSDNPEDKGIAAKLANARVELTRISLITAEKALLANALPKAWKHLTTAHESTPKDPRIDALRTRLRTATAKRLRGALTSRDYDAAYADLTLLQERDPGGPDLETLTTEIALSVFAHAQALEAKGDFYQAREQLNALGLRQPGYAKEAQTKSAAVTKRWANHLRVLAAKDEKANRLTSAYVRRAMVAGISQTHPDKKQLERIESAFIEAAGVIINTQITGDRHRTTPLREAVLAGLGLGNTLRWLPGARKGEQGGTIALERASCSEKSAEHTASQRYLAGQRSAINPDHQDMATIVSRATAAHAETIRGARAQQARVRSLEEAILASRRQENTLAKSLAAFTPRLDDARLEEAKARDLYEAAAKGSAALADRVAAQKAVWTARDAANQARAELKAAQTAVTASETRRAELSQRTQQAKDALAKAKAVLAKTPTPSEQDRSLAAQVEALQATLGLTRTALAAAYTAVARAKKTNNKAKVTQEKAKYATAKAQNADAKKQFDAARAAMETVNAHARAHRDWEKAKAAAKAGRQAESANADTAPDIAALEAKLATLETAVKEAEGKRAALPPLTNAQRVLASQLDNRRTAVKRGRQAVEALQRDQFTARARLTTQKQRTIAYTAQRESEASLLLVMEEQIRTQGLAIDRRKAVLSQIPPTVLVDVYEDFQYPVRQWTKTCRLRIDMKGARPRQPGLNQHLVAEATTQDSEHRGYGRYGVPKNRLEYPKTDAELVGETHNGLVPKVQAWFGRSMEEIRLARLDRATKAVGNNREAAIADFIIAWRMNRNALPPELKPLLEETYGAIEMAWLQ